MSKRSMPDNWFSVVVPFLHATIILTLVALFTWPAASAEPKSVPIGLVGSAQLTEQLSAQLEVLSPGAFAVTEFTSVDDAEESIEARELYGAIVFGPSIEVLTASAANASVSIQIQEIASQIQAKMLGQQGIMAPKVTVTELAESPENDPRGQVLGSAALPLVIAGISLGALVMMRVRNRWAQINVVGSSSLITGLVIAFFLKDSLGILPGELFMNTLAIAALIGSVAFALVGAHALIGLPGFGLLAATFFLLGNPLSGIAIPVEFYAEGWGQFGQLLPLGSGFELLKRVNFFDAADTSAQWWTLGIWVICGLGMWAVGQKARTSLNR